MRGYSGKRLSSTAGLLFLIVLAAPTPADAQDEVGAGLRAGLSVDPDQFYFGLHLEFGPLAEELRFRPNLEAGFGDDRTVIALNPEFIYPFALRDGYSVYVGAGPAVHVISFDNGPGAGDTEVEAGFNFLVGLGFPEPYFVELKVGAIDSPQVKLGVGFTFR